MTRAGILAAVAIAALGALAGGALFLRSGLYDISATEQHTAPVYWLLEFGMRRSVRRGAAGIEVPPLASEARIARGAAIYRSHCVQCHGAPGIAPEPFALGLMPAPANLAHTAREWPDAELYWVVRYGIKMTGMPAWAYRLGDEDLWAVVAFLRRLPQLSPEQYAAMMRTPPAATPATTNDQPGRGDAARGRAALHQYACGTCHRIPGITGAHAPVGPPLDGIGTRRFIAGLLPNSPENMVRWLRAPRELNPRTAMPDLGITERDARDIAAYLQSLR